METVGRGVAGLQEDLLASRAGPAGALPPLPPPGHQAGRVEELLDTLECPVCLGSFH